MDNIYNNSKVVLERKIPSKIISWITILVLIIIILFILSFIPFNLYKSYLGYLNIENNNTYITLIYNTDDFPFNKYDELYINYKKYKYEVINIDTKENIIVIDIDDNININNNIVKLYFLKERTTIFNIVKNKIKKGLMR